MKHLLGGTLALMLASFAFATPRTPKPDADQAGQSGAARAGASAKGKHGKHVKDGTGTHGKRSQTKPDANQPVVK